MITHSSGPKLFEVTGRLVLVCLVGFFLTVAAVNAIMIRFAITTFGGVETESSYKAGLAFRTEMDAALAQQARGWNVEIGVDPQPDNGVVKITVRDAAGRAIPNLTIALSLAHPADRRRDLPMSAVEQSPGVFRSRAPPVAGQWHLTTELGRDGQTNESDRSIRLCCARRLV